MVNEIEDESALNILMEDAAIQVTTKNTSTSNVLNADQWATIEKAQTQIKNGQYKTYDELKQHFRK
jgi:hypothetical protein